MPKDNPTFGEQEESLRKAIREVVGLYRGDQASRGLGSQTEGQRDTLWEDAGREHPAFTDNIRGIRRTIRTATESSRAYLPEVSGSIGVHFSPIKDGTAREFLTDVTIARASSGSGGRIDSSGPHEADAVVRELGLDGLRDERLEEVTIQGAISSVLTGKVKLPKRR